MPKNAYEDFRDKILTNYTSMSIIVIKMNGGKMYFTY